MGFVNGHRRGWFWERHGQPLPVTERVADVTDPAAFPNIAEAIEHARKLKEQNL